MRTISVNYVHYAIPANWTDKQVADLIVMLADLERVEETGEYVAGKYTTARYVDTVRVALERQPRPVFLSREEATEHLKALSAAAPQEEQAA